MTDDLEEDEDEIEWGVVPPREIPEPSGDHLTRKAESRQAALKLWQEVQREIRRTTL